MQVVVAKDILKANDTIASENRSQFDAAGIFAINMLGSPGAGKTTILEQISKRIEPRLKSGVIEGDLATSKDAERIDKLGWPVVQINTGGGCHLEANMVSEAMGSLDLDGLDVVWIENVGNLVCTSGYMLGERLRFVVLSTTEGDDKVMKYPPMFQRTQAVVVNKADLIEFTDFDLDRMREDVKKLNPESKIFVVSARTGDGFDELAAWIMDEVAQWREDAQPA